MLRTLLLTVAALAAAVLVTRAFIGPFVYGFSVHSPMNAASIFGAAVLLLILTAPHASDHTYLRPLAHHDWLAALALIAFLTFALWPTFSIGFVADDYMLMLTAARADLATVVHWFTVPGSDNLFFRPMAMASYWIDSHWAGYSAPRWHFAEWLLHALNALLVFAFARRLGLETLWAFAAAALFGVHGSRPEAVTWMSARFDLLATIFVLLTLHLFLTHRERPTPLTLAALLVTTFLGLYSKEAAFILPLLIVATAWFLGFRPTDRPTVLATFALTGMAFLYRWYVLGGIGGYKDAVTGQATVNQFHLWLTVKALALRLWAVLIVPLNWSTEPESLIAVALPLALAATLLLAWRAQANRLTLYALTFTFIASMPVYHLLLIGPDLEKSRVIYLPSIGFALALASVAQRLPQSLTLPALAAILFFQTAALRHNLTIWHAAADINAAACDQLAADVRNLHDGQIVAGAPNTWNGVYMLRTGLPECLAVRQGLPPDRISLQPDAPKADPFLGWDEKSLRFRPRIFDPPSAPPHSPPTR